MDKQLASPCGLYCGACGIYMATNENDGKLREKFSKAYGSSIEDTKCLGCLSEDTDSIYIYCKVCPIKTCVKQKNIEGCFQCDDFPCENVNNFPVAEGKKVILRAIPLWKKIGTEKWLEEEAKRYKCPQCQTSFYRLAKYCRKCKSSVNAY